MHFWSIIVIFIIPIQLPITFIMSSKPYAEFILYLQGEFSVEILKIKLSPLWLV